MSWLTVSEVAERYRRTERQVLSAIHRGHLPANRPTRCKEYRVSDEDAERVFGVAVLHAQPERAKRESESAKIDRQLRQAGVG